MITMAQKRFEMHLNPNLDGSYRIALNLAGNTENASDLVQESALRAFRSFHTFQEGTNFRAWFYRIITNLFLEWSRKRQREHISNEDVDVYLNNHFHNVSSHSPSPVADVIEKMDIERVHYAIHSLPEEYRIAATLYFIDDLSYQEIANIVDCPVGTVRSRLHRGRRLLKKALRPIAEQQGIIAACA